VVPAPSLLVLAASLLSPPPEGPGAVAALERRIAEAEEKLEQGAFADAESLYRKALFEGSLLRATLEALDGRMEAAKAALADASLFRVDRKDALVSLATLELQIGEPLRAAEVLADAAARPPRDVESLRLLARASASVGRMDAAADALRDAIAVAGDDPESLFVVATEYLWLKRPEEAERLFARVLAARPLPQTHVLIGRAYRDAGEYARAATELKAALARDPTVRRAHYYLGMCLLADAGASSDVREAAIAELRKELEIDPGDALTKDQLGVALLDADRPDEALPLLEAAARAEPRALTLQHLGRAQLALDRPADAAQSSRRALELAAGETGAGAEVDKIHYQLGLALRKLGQPQEATAELARSREAAARAAEDGARGRVIGTVEETSPLGALPPALRSEGEARVKDALARISFNLGVLQTQGVARGTTAERFGRAAAFFERAAAVDAAFPNVQRAWGVAAFNARQFAEAAGPLSRAVREEPGNAELARMLSLAYINTGAYDKAAPLLEKDPGRATDATLQSAYGLSLLRSGRSADAEKVLSGLVRTQGESADLLVLLGQAQADQGKWDPAVASLRKALTLDPRTAEAEATLERIEAARRRKTGP
jgi:tetratricopeptide (TPR) repeat protein